MEYQVLQFSLHFTAIIFLLFMVKFLWKRSQNSNLPPGPRKVPIIGNLHQLIHPSPHRRLRDLAEKHGSVMLLQLGAISIVVISSAEAAKEVMKTHDITFSSRPVSDIMNALTLNCSEVGFAPYGETWRQLRKISVMELLSAKRVKSFRLIREEEVEILINEISAAAGSPFNISKKLSAVTYDITARVTFGQKRCDHDELPQLLKELTKIVTGYSLGNLFPSEKLLGEKTSKLRELTERAYRIIENIIEDHKSAGEDDAVVGDSEDLVDLLLKLQKNREAPLTDDNIKAFVLEMFLFGSKTSAILVEWVMSELLNNRKAMEKAQEEVRKVYMTKRNVDEFLLHELNYLKLVIKETLRLHPPAPLLAPRQCRERCEINRYTIPKKVTVIINAWTISRDPKYWDDPESFKPERFLNSNIDYMGNNFEFIPFGAGRRICPGISFAMANIELQLAHLLYHFDWKLADEQEPEKLDMIESLGAAVGRKNDLHLIAIPHYPHSVE